MIPTDIGREYREVIRVNSQSGKGGVAYLLETEFGIELPKEMQREFGPIANDEVDRLGREVSGAELKAMFWREYIERTAPWQLRDVSRPKAATAVVQCRRHLAARRTAGRDFGRRQRPAGRVWFTAFSTAERAALRDRPLQRTRLERRRRSRGHRLHPNQARSDGRARWGAGVDTNIELASVRAVLSALNRLPPVK